MRSNRLSSEGTGQLFSILLQSACLNTIRKIDLFESCDFSSDETCAIFAEFIDKALQLRECGIGEQVGERVIKDEVEVVTAEIDGKLGSIKITE